MLYYVSIWTYIHNIFIIIFIHTTLLGASDNCNTRWKIHGYLTHWGREAHRCVVNLDIFGSDNGLQPGRLHAIIWTNAGILLIRPLRTNFSEILIAIHIFSVKKTTLETVKMAGKSRPICFGINVLMKTSAKWKECRHLRLLHWSFSWFGSQPYFMPEKQGVVIVTGALSFILMWRDDITIQQF